MKVLNVTPTFAPAIGGIESVVRDLSFYLKLHGIHSDVMHISTQNKYRRDLLSDDSIIWRIPLKPNRLVGFTPDIKFILNEYDLIHVHDPQTMAISFNALTQNCGKKIVLSTHGGFFHTSQFKWFKTFHWDVLAPSFLRQYDMVFASSESDFETYKSKTNRIKLVPNGVDVSKFAAVTRTQSPPSTRWIYWGRLSRNKRLDLLINAVASARNNGVEVDLLIAGTDFDGLAQSLNAEINSLDLNRQVRIVGQLSEKELMQEIASRAVFATASEYEGFGLSVIEAMAAGLVVICRDVAPLNGFVSEGKNGSLLRFDSGEADLRSIINICELNSNRLSVMQGFARATAQSHDWKSVILKYIDAYNLVLGTSGASSNK
jgi:alpha-1,3-mannosyltransferase